MNGQATLTLARIGWSDERARWLREHLPLGAMPGRVTDSARHLAMTETGPTEYILQRQFVRDASGPEGYPAVGDWLALEMVSDSPRQGAVRGILPRNGTFIRQRPSDGQRQVLAANVDTAFLVSGLDNDLNLRRIERYLVLALDGGVTPVVVLNKVDIAIDLERAVAEVHRIAAGTRVIVTSAVEGTGLDEMQGFLTPGTTACLLGSSGVGKSTLTNAVLGEERQATKALREDDSKGRHTTTHRELFAVPGGGMLIDTPGLRTVGVLGDEDSLGATFDEVESLARQCRFSDCHHEGEPGCAVDAAIKAGTLSPDRLASHHKLEAERHHAEIRSDQRARREADRKLGKFFKQHKKQLRRQGKLDY